MFSFNSISPIERSHMFMLDDRTNTCSPSIQYPHCIHAASSMRNGNGPRIGNWSFQNNDSKRTTREGNATALDIGATFVKLVFFPSVHYLCLCDRSHTFVVSVVLHRASFPS